MRRLFLLVAALGAAPLLGSAQGTRTDYARAEQLLNWNASELVIDDAVRPRFMAGERFWYRNRGPNGYVFLVVDMATGTRRPAFDHARLAASLSQAADTAFDPARLPFRDLVWVQNESAIRFSTGRAKTWTCSVSTYACAGPDTVPVSKPSESRSPDGRLIVFERGGNLYLRPTDGSAKEVALTTDGTPEFGYGFTTGGTNTVTTARNRTEQAPTLSWSPDGRKIATHKWDVRGVRQMYLLETKNPGPVLHSYRYALPSDSVVPRYELLTIDVGTRAVTKVDRTPMEASNTTCCWLSTADTVWKDVKWSPSSDRLFFTVGARSFRQLELVSADASTGSSQRVLMENAKTFVETNQNSGGIPNWRPIAGGKQVVWWSERDGWGHLYRVDAATGAVINRITSGDWMVSDLLAIDETLGWVYFTARGREKDRDPYFRHLYRAKLDGSAIELLTPEDADHEVTIAPSGKFVVDAYSRPDVPPVSVIRRPDGTRVAELQKADISRLLAAGWRAPRPFRVKARDNTTDLYGLLWFPAGFDSTKTYPIVDYIYPGPQVGSLGGRQFRATANGNANALAELGFFVVQVDAMGTPGRSKAFHDAYYGNMADNGIPDQIATIKQLAARHRQIDIARVGIYGHSGGGFSSTDAILRYPDFFKVAVSSAGNHDNRSYDYTWGEKYQGRWTRLSDSTDNFDSQSNWRIAKNLKGKLMLSYGTLDDNVHPVATQLVIDELIKANRDFDLVVMPNRNHGFASEPYWVRRTWDYFVRHLLGVEPPAGYEIRPAGGGM
ncbi:MAG: DPP IV N-terminal domain-containing protein [Gemmatimonadaceae bacterium]|nr:DPP IV N-terminal domain-containing protein [Gemmatimonadaceae bacterium]